MDPAQLEKAIHDGIAAALEAQLPIAVQSAVDAAVNSKVKKLSDDMQPLVNAYGKWLTGRRMVIVAFGVLIALGSIIQSGQALWEIVQHYFVIRIK